MIPEDICRLHTSLCSYTQQLIMKEKQLVFLEAAAFISSG